MFFTYSETDLYFTFSDFLEFCDFSLCFITFRLLSLIFSMFSVVTIIVWRGALLVANGEMASDELGSFVVMTIFVGASFGALPDLYADLVKTVGVTEKLVDLMELEQENIEELKNKIEIGNVAFKNVHFNYPQREDIEVLKGISFDIKAGETVALVGSSGAGKSTISSLLLSFYQPTKGSIVFDSNIESANINSVRDAIGYVPQEVILFGGTIKENIAYGNLNATDDEIVEAAKKANAFDFIESFPDQWETLVGARGIQLSGGQRQRIAIARALLKDPKILILDEATSALDSNSEKVVQDALEKLMKGRTSFVIAHRLSTIRNADKILVLDNGNLIESGTHQELLELKGSYFKLNQLQVDTK